MDGGMGEGRNGWMNKGMDGGRMDDGGMGG